MPAKYEMPNWYEACAREREDRVAVRLYNADDTLRQSIIMPTIMYPLAEGDMRTFYYENTEEIADENILRIVDTMPFRPGFCYMNTKELSEKLRAEGYDVKTYAGWLFSGPMHLPVHHAWCVLDGNKVIDLSDILSGFANWLSSHDTGAMDELIGTVESSRRTTVSYAKMIAQMPLSKVISLGRPSPTAYLVGTECDPDKARQLYNRLMEQYPDHETAKTVNSEGLNPTHAMYYNS